MVISRYRSFVATRRLGHPGQTGCFGKQVLTQVRRRNRQEERVRIPYDERCSEPHRPRVMRVTSRGVRRSVDRGVGGPGIEPRNKTVRDADAFCVAEGSTVGRVIASASLVPRGLRPWHINETFCPGTGRSHGWPSEEGRSASGRLEGRSR